MQRGMIIIFISGLIGSLLQSDQQLLRLVFKEAADLWPIGLQSVLWI